MYYINDVIFKENYKTAFFQKILIIDNMRLEIQFVNWKTMYFEILC